MASRNQNLDEVENPCKKFFKWETVKEVVTVDGEDFTKVKGGQFVYYDRDAPNPQGKDGKGKNIPAPSPFEFAVLNPDMVCWKGFDKPNSASIWTNEVTMNKDNELYSPNALVNVIHSKNKELFNFTVTQYANKDTKDSIKKNLKDAPAKYTQSVYICFKNEEGEWELGNLQLSGGSLTGAQDRDNPDDQKDGWFAYCKDYPKSQLFKYSIVVDGIKVKKKEDGGKFTIPVYTRGETISKQDNEVLSEMDTKLTEYLKFYLNKGTKKEQEVTADVTEEDDYTN